MYVVRSLPFSSFLRRLYCPTAVYCINNGPQAVTVIFMKSCTGLQQDVLHDLQGASKQDSRTKQERRSLSSILCVHIPSLHNDNKSFKVPDTSYLEDCNSVTAINLIFWAY